MIISFKTTENFIIRCPIYPVNTVYRLFEDNESRNNLFRSLNFKRAIIWASAELYKEYTKYLSESLRPKDMLRMQQTLLKYAVRMSYRSTLYGEFASIGVGSFSQITRINDPGIIKKRIYLDSVLENTLFNEVTKLETIKKNEETRYSLNGTIIRKGDYIYHMRSVLEGRQIFVATKYNRILDRLLKSGKKVYSFNNVECLIFGNSKIDEEDKIKFISTLIDSQLLIPLHHPEAMGESWLKKYQDLTEESLNLISYTSKCLKLVESLTSSDEIFSHLSKLKLNISDKGKNIKNIVQLVSYSSNKPTIKEEIKTRIIESIDFFSKITSYQKNWNIQNFIRDFLNRYDQQAIPLLEALNPEIGIGYGGSTMPKTNELINNIEYLSSEKNKEFPLLNKLEQLLQIKIKESNNNTIHLTDEDVKDLDSKVANMPASISAIFSLTGNNDEVISELHFSGTSATCLIGRFTLGYRKLKSIASIIASHEQNYYKNNGKIAEINLLPNSRCGNVNYRARFRKYRICSHKTTSYFDIPLNDLAVSIENGVIKLKSIKSGDYIIPRLSSAHNNYSGSDVVYQFLGDLQCQREINSLYFSWGKLRHFYTHFPRVYYKTIIISLEEWCLQTNLIKNKNDYQTKKYLNWIQEQNVPRFVKLVVGDNELLIDNECDLSIKTLFHELKNKQMAILRECPYMNELKLNDNPRYANQIIIPILKCT